MRDLDSRTPAFPAGPEAAPQTVTRRGLGLRLAGATAAFGLGGGAARALGTTPTMAPAPTPLAAPLDADLRDAALRGLALAGHRGDPVTAAAARATLARLETTDPEAAILGRLYERLDVRPAAYWAYRQDEPLAAPTPEALATLHDAIRACRPLRFDYTDMGGNQTTRQVLPLALVHPPQGVKLLAWCETAQGYRQFFVRAIAGLALAPGDFTAVRLELLQGLLAKESGQAEEAEDDDDGFGVY